MSFRYYYIGEEDECKSHNTYKYYNPHISWHSHNFGMQFHQHKLLHTY